MGKILIFFPSRILRAPQEEIHLEENNILPETHSEGRKILEYSDGGKNFRRQAIMQADIIACNKLFCFTTPTYPKINHHIPYNFPSFFLPATKQVKERNLLLLLLIFFFTQNFPLMCRSGHCLRWVAPLQPTQPTMAPGQAPKSLPPAFSEQNLGQIFVIKCRLDTQFSANIPTELPFCIPPSLVGCV